ncbi:MAG: NADH-quinone oxidoreductase subunit D [Deltaproteobacteria bacterium]|nr:NADH-quinone oxidoreductase subunit D [Deltaproteobacteria bacterium]
MVATVAREELLLNMGPHHPSTHGVLRFILHTDGEIMRKAVPDVGYLHRGIEKIAEQHPYANFLPFGDRVNYLEAIFVGQAYAMAVERLAGIVVPPRAEYLRIIAAELNRIISHFITLGSVTMDIGAYTPFLYLLRERERGNDLMEALCGQRLTYNYIRIGGVAYDAEEQWLKDVDAYVAHLEPVMKEFDSLISGNEIFVKRLANIATINANDAKAWGLVGPNLRASGVDWDLRRDQPYSAYNDINFEVPIGTGFRGVVGDCYDRFYMRVLEIKQSIKIVRQAIAKLPTGEIRAKVSRLLKIPAGETYSAVEGARGEFGVYLVADGSDKPYRLKMRSGSFAALSIIEHVSRGLMIADLVAVIATLDVLAPEMDR